MEIERINENTVKFYISYLDIEERGFDREEIWYNRERSEELFWEMMDEIHQEEEFSVEGPLWIQVQALEKGLEVLVTRAQVSKDGNRYELPIPDEKLKALPEDESIGAFIQEQLNPSKFTAHNIDDLVDDSNLKFLILFDDFEDVISLANCVTLNDMINKLYHFENRYYLYVELTSDEISEDDLDNLFSLLLEYGRESALSVYRLQEYGKIIIDDDALSVIEKYFCK